MLERSSKSHFISRFDECKNTNFLFPNHFLQGLNFILSNSTKEQEKTQDDIEVLDIDDLKRSIVVHNDDFNTFDHVIRSLIEICGHTLCQAEQCTYIIHYKGKCGVQSGDLEELRPKCKRLLNKGLTAEIV